MTLCLVTLFRKLKDKPQTPRNYFQNTHLIKDLYSNYANNTIKIW